VKCLSRVQYFHLFIANLIFFTFCSSSYGSELMRKVNQSIDSSMTAARQAKNAKALATLDQAQKQIQPLGMRYDEQLKKCQESKDSTDYNCLEGNDKGVNQFVSAMGTISDMGSMAMSSSCSKLADLMKMGKGAQTAFRAQCAMVKSNCVSTCEEAEKTIKQIHSILSQTQANTRSILSYTTGAADKEKEDIAEFHGEANHAVREECIAKVKARGGSVDEMETCAKSKGAFGSQSAESGENAAAQTFTDVTAGIAQAQAELEKPTDNESPASLKKACQASAQEATGKATMNIANLAMTMQQNQACADELATFDSGIDLKDCNLTGTCTPTDPANDCKDPKYKESVYCKGIAGNNSGGAANGGATNSGNVPNPNFDLGGKGTLGDLNMNGTGDLASLDPNDPNSPFNKINGGEGSKSAGVPGGGGGGGLSIPGGGYNPRGGGRGPGPEGASYGGSPSYAGSGNYGGGSGDKNKEDLDKYLPGGEKDPTLAKKGGPEGITAPGGLTLFEKVTKSYRNNRSSLIPE
jgi:hypothetical protein